MAVRKVIVMGHPTLRKVAEPISEAKIKSTEIQQLLKDMTETMFEYDGRGLAAPQINESVQAIVMLWDFEPDKEPSLIYLINPVITPLTKETSTYGEGCLSVPGLRGNVSRPNKIAVKALNHLGDKLDFVAEGFAATVIQHECDHLLGKLYVDHITDMTQLAFNREYSRFLSKDETASEES